MLRLLLPLVLLVSIAPHVSAQYSYVSAQYGREFLQVGDSIAVRMYGELAKEYAQRTGMHNNLPDNGTIETVAKVVGRYQSNRIRIEFSDVRQKTKSGQQLVKLTVSVASNLITKDMLREDRLGNGSFTVRTSADIEVDEPRLNLSNLILAKIQTWALVDEIGSDFYTSTSKSTAMNRFTRNPLKDSSYPQ